MLQLRMENISASRDYNCNLDIVLSCIDFQDNFETTLSFTIVNTIQNKGRQDYWYCQYFRKKLLLIKRNNIE